MAMVKRISVPKKPSVKYPNTCIECRKEFQASWPHQRTCTRECRHAFNQKNAWVTSGLKKLGVSSGTVGAISELRVAVDLMMRGYDVFRALSPACSCDLAMIKDGRLIRIEVRTGYLAMSGNVITSKRTHRADYLAIALPSGIVYEPELPIDPKRQATPL